MDASLAWNDDLAAAPEQSTTNTQTPTTHAFGGSTEPVVIAVIAGLVLAEMALEALRDEGIPAMLRRNPVGAVYGLSGGAWGSVPLLVPAPLADAAREVLQGLSLLPEDDV